MRYDLVMQRILWAPWRKKYITTTKKKIQKGCLFCRLQAAPPKKDAANLLLHRSSHSFLMLNLYPYNNGHLMAVPNRHVDTLESLKDSEKLDLLTQMDRSLAALRKVFHPEGFNIGINLGRSGGAGIPGHVHIHIVPRWNGDTNFMPVIGKTKVISDSLAGTYKTLHRLLKR